MLLTTPQLLLREFTEADVAAVHGYQDDVRFLRHHPRDAVSEAEARELVARFVGWQREEPRWRCQLAITLRETGTVIGNAGLRRDFPDVPVADLGFELAADHW